MSCAPEPGSLQITPPKTVCSSCNRRFVATAMQTIQEQDRRRCPVANTQNWPTAGREAATPAFSLGI
jgi:hypothetical protein